jgi:tetratricopeptide (TPR) repeat protein
VAVLSPRGRALLVFSGIVLAGGVGASWWLARRLPVEEAHRFMTAPVVVGDRPRPAPAPAAGPIDVDARFAAAEDAFHAGHYEEAATAFAAVVAADPNGPHAGPAEWNLTRSRLRSGDGMGALTAFHDLTSQYAGYLGDQAPGLREGLERMQSGDLPGAQKALEGMIHDQPDSEFVPVAHALIARIHWTHGEPMETVRSFARMFASVRDPVPAYSNLAWQLERYADGDPDAPERFERAAKDAPKGFGDIYQYLAARSLLEQDHYAAARDALDTLRRRYPDGDFSQIVDLEHAWNDLRNGKAADALAIFERLEKTPDPPGVAAFDEFFDLRAELPMGIARAHAMLGDHAAAAAAYERALAADPHSIYAVANSLALATEYEHLGRLPDAEALLKKTITAHPDEPKLWALRQQLARIEAGATTTTVPASGR